MTTLGEITYTVELFYEERLSKHGVHVPDVPGVMAYGDTPDQAMANATEALRADLRERRTHDGELSVPEACFKANELDGGKYARVTISLADLLPK